MRLDILTIFQISVVVTNAVETASAIMSNFLTPYPIVPPKQQPRSLRRGRSLVTRAQ